MRTVLVNTISASLLFLLLIALVVAAPPPVVSRTSLNKDGYMVDVTVRQDRSLTYGLTTISPSRKGLTTHTGILAGRGYWPINIYRPATPSEIAFYQQVVH